MVTCSSSNRKVIYQDCVFYLSYLHTAPPPQQPTPTRYWYSWYSAYMGALWTSSDWSLPLQSSGLARQLPHWPQEWDSPAPLAHFQCTRAETAMCASGKGWIESCIVPEPRSCSLNSYKGLLKRPCKMLRMDFYYHVSAFPPQSRGTDSGPSPLRAPSLPAFIVLLLHRAASLLCPWNLELPITPHTPLITLSPPVRIPWPSSLLPLLAKCSDVISSREPSLAVVRVA